MPAGETVHTQGSEAMQITAPKESPSVLVVDDDKTMRLLMRESLEKDGFIVEEAADGYQAVATFMRMHPDIVLLDVMMPQMDGIDTCSELRKFPGGENVPVVMVTGLENVEFIKRAYKAGATDFITKPLNWVLLSHRVRYVLRASQTVEELCRSQEALREREERLQAIFETASDLIVTLDLDGTFTSVNRAAEITLGLDRTDLIGQPFTSFLTSSSASYAQERLQKALQRDPVSPTFEIEACRSDGTHVPLEAKARFLKEQSQRVGMVCVLRDITQEKALKQQRAEFLSMLTHDIRNPISVISGCTELLIETAQAREDEVEEDILRKIHGNTLTVRSLVTNYLDCSKIEAGHLTLAKQRLDLNDILRQVVRQYETEAQRQGLTLLAPLSNSLPLFEADPLGLERIFTNLLHNAIKFTPEGGNITIFSEQHHDTLFASVADTGPGIDPQELPELFHKYHRATQTQVKEGTGLGLFIAKTLTEAHGGQISATSTVGQGTMFTVQLPLQHTPQQLAQQPDARLI